MKNRILGVVGTFLLIFCLCSVSTFGQFSHVKIGVNGMTCSACTKSVEKSFRNLPFVESVVMNLEKKSGEIAFKKGQPVDIDKVANAVVDAGFSVRFLTADYSFIENTFLTSELSENGYHFYFLRSKPTQRNCSLRFIGQKFQTKNEFVKSKNEFPEIDFKKSGLYFVIPIEKP